MKRSFELFEIEASMLPIFSTDEWLEMENLTDKPTNSGVIAYGFDKKINKYVPLYQV